jgi:predicted Fe-Mo cluster-binding NifX family protein
MMIALPLATKKKTSHISALFGKAKCFALFNGNTIEVLDNEINSGKRIATWLQEKGVTKLIVKHMGKRPFEMLQNLGIEVYFCDEKIASNEAVVKLLNEELTLITPQNYNAFLSEEQTLSASPKTCCHSKRDNFVSMKGHSRCH